MTLKSKQAPYNNGVLTGREKIIIYDEEGRGQLTSIANLLNRIDANLFKINKGDDEDLFLRFNLDNLTEPVEIDPAELANLSPSYLPYDGFVPNSAGDQASATELTAVNNIVVLGGDDYSVKFPAGEDPDKVLYLVNWRNYSLKVYPGSGDDFDGFFGGGVDEPITLQPFEVLTIYGIGDTGVGNQTWLTNISNANVGGVLGYAYSGVSTTAVTGLEVLDSKVMPGRSMYPGDVAHIEANFIFAPNANGKRCRIKMFNEVLAEFDTLDGANQISVRLKVRLGNHAGSPFGSATVTASSGFCSSTNFGYLGDFTADNTIEFTGENSVASAGDIQLFDYSIEIVKKKT